MTRWLTTTYVNPNNAWLSWLSITYGNPNMTIWLTMTYGNSNMTLWLTTTYGNPNISIWLTKHNLLAKQFVKPHIVTCNVSVVVCHFYLTDQKIKRFSFKGWIQKMKVRQKLD